MFALLRGTKENQILVLINVSDDVVELKTGMAGSGLLSGKQMNQEVTLEPYEYLWMKNNTTYDVTDLTSLEKLEPVRVRPGMYIGSIGSKGLHHCVWEILDNAIDEISNGYGNKAQVILNKDKSVTIKDNGRGIPTGIHPIKKKSGVEMVFSELHTGGKFNNKNYKTSGGLHGVGAAVVNALSKWVLVEVYQGGNIYRQRFEYAYDKELKRDMPGTPVTKLDIVGNRGTWHISF